MYTQGRPDHILANEGRRCSRHITGRSEPVNSSDLCRDWASCSAPVNVGNFRTESDLRVILSQGLFGSWSGVIFRSVSPRYARAADIVSGYGSYRAGGRWNAPGIYAIYGGIEPGLAADESFNFLLRQFGWQNRGIPPRHGGWS